MPLYIAKSGDLEGCHACLTDSQSKDRATQLLTKYKSGALVTQLMISSSDIFIRFHLQNTSFFLGFSRIPLSSAAMATIPLQKDVNL